MVIIVYLLMGLATAVQVFVSIGTLGKDEFTDAGMTTSIYIFIMAVLIILREVLVTA